jgi:hypothetical protein
MSVKRGKRTGLDKDLHVGSGRVCVGMCDVVLMDSVKEDVEAVVCGECVVNEGGEVVGGR